MVGNDNEIECHQLCEGVIVQVQNQTFMVEFHVLPLCGLDVVLGVRWLKSLGTVLIDYNDLKMKFMHNGRIIELKGNSDISLHLITPSQLRWPVQTEGASGFFHIQVLPLELSSTKTQPFSHQYFDIAFLTCKFAALFQTPTSLPPSCNTNHAIHLLSNLDPVNVCPYCYPHFQKQEIKN